MAKKNDYSPRPKKLRRSVEFSTLLPAIIDNVMAAPTGSLVAFETCGGRTKTEVHVGYIWRIDGTHVYLWDETRGWAFGFDLSREEKPVVKLVDSSQVTHG
jgi:hypothetical protein